MIKSCGYLLVVHGSRNSSYQKKVNILAELVKKNLDSQGLNPLVTTAYLELGEKPLGEKIVDFAKICQTQKYKKLKILPLFLLAGTHVKEDIPHEVAQALKITEVSNVNISIELSNYLGSNQKFINLLTQKFVKDQDDKVVIIAHGTTLKNGNQELENLAQKLGYELAFWSISPSLTEKINILIEHNYNNIVILPYFLFTGKITEAIAKEVTELQQQNPHINLTLLEPIGAKPELAKIISQILLA